MRIKDNFKIHDVCGETILMATGKENLRFNKVVHFNETSAFIWNKAKEIGDFTGENLVEALTEEYEVTVDVAKKDIANLIAQWKELGVLEE